MRPQPLDAARPQRVGDLGVQVVGDRRLAAGPRVDGARGPAARPSARPRAARPTARCRGPRPRLSRLDACCRALPTSTSTGPCWAAAASLLHDGDGGFTLLGARALEACARAEVEVVPYSGRRQSTLLDDARLLGLRAYIFEAGCGLVLDGELEWLTDGLEPRDGKTIHEQIEESGAPALLLEHYAGRLRYTSPGTTTARSRTSSAATRSTPSRPTRCSTEHGHGDLRLVDNGVMPGVTAGRPRVPPDPARGLQGARRRAPHAGPRLRAGGVHRGRRLARGPRRCRRRRHVLARRQRARARPGAARGDGAVRQRPRRRGAHTAPASTRP